MATKKEADGNHPASHYLVVEDSSKPSTWHLRVRDASGKVDHTLMGAAWAALHGGYRGNKYQGPGKAQALAKLRRLYASENMPLPGEKTMTAFFKDRKNDMWFVGVFSNNFEDRQEDIITEAAHKEYAEWLKTTGVQPPIIMLHLPHFPDVVHYAMLLGVATGKMSVDDYNKNMMELYQSTAIAQTKSVVVKNGFSFVIGKVIESKRSLAEKLLKMQNKWGMSHGFIPLKKDDNIINMYRTFEFTVAPEAFIANEVTAIGFKEDKMEGDLLKELIENKELLSDEEREEVQRALNEADAETATAKARDILRNLLASKMEVEIDDTEVEDTEDAAEDTTDDSYKTLVTKLAADFKLEELAKVIGTIGDRLQALEQGQQEISKKITVVDKTEDQRVVDQYFKNQVEIDWTLGFGRKAAEEPDKDEQALIDQLKGDMPKQIVEGKVDSENPLDLMFWGPLLNKS